jgi:hypothetical protein
MNIKNIPYLFALIWIMSCSPDEFPEIGTPADRVSQLRGTWQISSVIQRDDDAIRKGFPSNVREQDITNVFPYTDFSITLEISGGVPTEFTIIQGGSPNIIGGLNSGTWALDDNELPSTITLTEGSAAYNIEIGSFADIKNTLLLKVQRKLLKSGVPESFITYEYIFTKN